MGHKRDWWEKPRTQGEHFTEKEIGKLRAAYNEGRRARDIACELECSTRVVCKYYAKFRGYPLQRGRSASRPQEPRPAPKSSRFYTSTFELEEA